MMRFLRSRIHPDAKRAEKEEFFEFVKSLQHGFSSKASCLAHDPQLNLLAVGTQTGHVKIFGAPGVEFTAKQPNDKAVAKLFFLPNQGRVISLCEDQTVHLWEVNLREGRGQLDHVKEVETEGKLKTISSSCLQPVEGEAESTPAQWRLLIGTEGGNVYALNTSTFELKDYVIYQDAIVQSIPEDFKVSAAGALESLAVCPSDSNKLLLGYNRGLIVLWDCANNCVLQSYMAEQSLESLHWHSSGSKFTSSHNDGSYVVWSTGDNSKPLMAPCIPFGPFPCKPIERIVWKTTRTDDDELLLFTGGMPRASYGDRYTVAAQRKAKQIVFDFTSKVIDLITIDCNDSDGIEEPHTLLVLCEEELVGIDLLDADWSCLRLPYQLPLHASPITACQHVANVSSTVRDALAQAGQEQAKGKFKLSERAWPIQGGRVSDGVREDTDLLVTGHEDGTVKFWNAGSASMSLIYILNTAKLFDGYNDPSEAQQEEDDWPPFRKVGLYDPFSDDPRFGIQRVFMEPTLGILVVGATAGQVMVWEMNNELKEMSDIPVIEAEIVTDSESFVWKGHDKLKLHPEPRKFYSGFAPRSVIQVLPPAAVTALSAQAEWGVVAIGTAHGFALVDFIQGKTVCANCLLSAEDLAAHEASALEGAMTRFKSFKKSLRDSFRRRRRHGGESPRKTPSPAPAEKQSPKKEKETTPVAEEGKEAEVSVTVEPPSSEPAPAQSSPAKSSPKKSPEPEEAVKPIERAIEARTEQPEVLPSLVRCLYFAKTFATSASSTSRTLWVGTNGGGVQMHLITFPEADDKREEEAVQCQLAKEIRLRHAAPVLNICIVDSKEFPIELRPTGDAGVEGAERVIISSEEQLKSFSLPTLKPSRHKYKLTANEGSRIRKVQYANLQSKTDSNKWESFLVTVTNQGEAQAFAVRSFKRYLKTQCTKPTDAQGIQSTVLSSHGEALQLLPRGCEWQRLGFSATYTTAALCSLELPHGVRPEKGEETKEEEKKEEEPKQDEQDAGETNAVQSAESPTPAADTSVQSTDTPNTTMPTDITVDSIRDYTQESSERTETIESSVQDGVTTESVTTVTKTTVTSSDQGDVVVVEKHLVNGDAEDEIAKLKDEIKKATLSENGETEVQNDEAPAEVVAQ